MNDSNLLVRALRANAAYSIVSGSTIAIGAAALDDWTGVPAWLLVAVGVGLIGFAVALLVGAGRPSLLVDVGRTAVLGDVAWLIGVAALVLATDWLTTGGEVTLVLISIPVAAFAAAQWLGLRRLGDRGTNAERTGHSAATGADRRVSA